MANHVVTQGECLSSIAYQYGFFPESLWNFPANASLKSQRKEMNLLLPGDTVVVPEKREGTYSGSTMARYRFQLKGVPAKLRVQYQDQEGKPRPGVAYTLTVDGKETRGATDGNGMVETAIPPNAQQGVLVLGTGDEAQEYEFDLGFLDPKDAISGIQGRLLNLGYYAGEIDGVMNDRTRTALKHFQTIHNLTATGEADSSTISKLAESHGS